DIQDIDGHLRGGIPDRDLDALQRYWNVFPGVRASLFQKGDRPGYAALKVAAVDLKSTIFGHGEFTKCSTQTTTLFAAWRAESDPRLRAIAKATSRRS
ncbi:MAG: type I restriction endonuclease subunit M, partial [Deltaproteobacteria bacterium]|nr:type I restriction endonuclease subunit M [Deltaproteobacteria bacterium]